MKVLRELDNDIEKQIDMTDFKTKLKALNNIEIQRLLAKRKLIDF